MYMFNMFPEEAIVVHRILEDLIVNAKPSKRFSGPAGNVFEVTTILSPNQYAWLKTFYFNLSDAMQVVSDRVIREDGK